MSFKTLRDGTKNVAAVGFIYGSHLLGVMCLLVVVVLALAMLAFVVCSKDGDRRVAIFERVVIAFRSHSPPRRRNPK